MVSLCCMDLHTGVGFSHWCFQRHEHITLSEYYPFHYGTMWFQLELTHWQDIDFWQSLPVQNLIIKTCRCVQKNSPIFLGIFFMKSSFVSWHSSAPLMLKASTMSLVRLRPNSVAAQVNQWVVCSTDQWTGSVVGEEMGENYSTNIAEAHTKHLGEKISHLIKKSDPQGPLWPWT